MDNTDTEQIEQAEPLGAKLDPATLTLRIDQQEKHPICPAPMQSIVCHLSIADYALLGIPETEASCERKGEPDIVQCCGIERDRFLRGQVPRLMGCRHKVLVVESTWERLSAGGWRSKVSPQSVLGTLESLMLDGLPVALVGSHEEAGKFITRWFTCWRTDAFKNRASCWARSGTGGNRGRPNERRSCMHQTISSRARRRDRGRPARRISRGGKTDAARVRHL